MWYIILIRFLKLFIKRKCHRKTKYTVVAPKTPLQKLKDYWLNNGGDDYLEKLLKLRNDIPSNHKSSAALDEELHTIRKVHKRFVAWSTTKVARAQLNKVKKS